MTIGDFCKYNSDCQLIHTLACETLKQTKKMTQVSHSISQKKLELCLLLPSLPKRRLFWGNQLSATMTTNSNQWKQLIQKKPRTNPINWLHRLERQGFGLTQDSNLSQVSQSILQKNGSFAFYCLLSPKVFGEWGLHRRCLLSNDPQTCKMLFVSEHHTG